MLTKSAKTVSSTNRKEKRMYEKIEKGIVYKVRITFVSDRELTGRELDEAIGDALCNTIGGDYDIGEYEEEINP